jgi:hypothetical protein
MTALKMRAFFGIVGLAGAGFLLSGVTSTVGCSSSSGGSGGSGGKTPGTGGSGGSSAGTAGTTGSGGTSTGGSSGGASGGSGGSTAAVGCQMSANPPSATIADFATLDGGTPVIPIGGVFTYAGGAAGAVAPTASVANGAWHVTLNSTAMDMPQYVGVGIYFNGNSDGTDCVDATTYTGIQFDLTGTIGGTGCTAQYSTNDSEHSDSTKLNADGTPVDKKASGPMNAYAPQAPLTVPTGSATVMMPFTTPTGGSPATAIDKMKLTGVQWQFTVPMTTGGCMVDITIDNVKFY